MSKYAPYLQYVIDNIKKTPVAELAKTIGVTADALKKQITKWRKSGIPVPGKKITMIGDLTTKNDRGRTYQLIKTENGWVRTNIEPSRRIKSVKSIVKKKNPPVSTKRTVKVNYNVRVPKVKEFKTRKQDLSQKVPLFIPELRMTVYMSQGASVEEIRAKYLGRQAI